MTLRLYADRKEWKLQAVKVELSHERVHARDCAECEQQSGSRIDLIRRYITVTGALDAVQCERLLQIAERCPVHRTLDGGPTILTELDVVQEDFQRASGTRVQCTSCHGLLTLRERYRCPLAMVVLTLDRHSRAGGNPSSRNAGSCYNTGWRTAKSLLCHFAVRNNLEKQSKPGSPTNA